MIDWLFRLALDVSLIIGVIFLLRPTIRKLLGANVVYWLWGLLLIRTITWSKPEVPRTLLEATSQPGGVLDIHVFPNPELLVVSDANPWLWVWIIGAIVWGSIRALSWLSLQKLLTQTERFLSDTQSQAIQVFLEGRRRYVRFALTPIDGAPLVTGLLRPTVYLPTDFFERYSTQQQQWIVEHELGHIDRQDLWALAVAEVVRCLLWFHPLVHIAWTAFREDQELACDHRVLRGCNQQERYEYGTALRDRMLAPAVPSSLSFFNKHKERFMLLDDHKHSTIRNVLGLTLFAAVAIFTLTKAPSAVADRAGWPEDPVRLHFDDIELSKGAKLIFDFAGYEVINLEILEPYLVDIKVENVMPLDAVNLLLDCHGFAMQLEGKAYRIVPVAPASNQDTSSQVCIDSNL